MFKPRKIGRHLRRLNLNLQGQLRSETRFIIWAESATIRPSGRMGGKRLKAIKESQARHGVRKDRSRQSVERTLGRAAKLTQTAKRVILNTDEKSSYPSLAKAAFGKEKLTHLATNSKLVRATWNPLFAINNEEAIMRDLMGRLRRESWLVSKKRRFLDLALHVHIAYRNLVRRRFNRDKESPAQLLGFLPLRMMPGEVLSWRQDWKEGSIHPLSRAGSSIRAWKNRALAFA